MNLNTTLKGYRLLHFMELVVDYNDDLDAQHDQLLLGWIFSSLTPSLVQVASYTTSVEVWTMLHDIYGATSLCHYPPIGSMLVLD